MNRKPPLLKSPIPWFEDGWRFFFVKLLLIVNLYCFVIEPLLYTYFIKVNSFDFLNRNKALYVFVLGLLSVLAGYIYGKLKRAVFTLWDGIFLFLIGYSFVLGYTKYDLYPIGSSLKYIYLLLFNPIVTLVTYGFTNMENIWNNFTFAGKRRAFILFKLTNDFKCVQPIAYTLKDRNGIRFSSDLPLRNLEHGIKRSDLLGYYDLAEVILSAITSLTHPKAFSIGLNGSWGSGKSSLIDILIDDLIPNFNKKQGGREIRVISFSPWLYPDQNSIISNFFMKWKDEIDDPWLKIIFDDYTYLLNDIKIGGITFKLQNLFSESKSLEKVKNKIEKYLRSSKYTYLIVIDDLDRLEKKEILEIAKLSRVLADFPNTYYLLAYDRQYIDLALKEENNSEDKRHTYFDKIIQLEFKIPQITELKLSSLVRSLIQDNQESLFAIDNDLTEGVLDECLYMIQYLNVYQHFLPTIRDIKRFVNGFLLRYSALIRGKHRVRFTDIFLLEMIFYRYKQLYEPFYNGRDKGIDLGLENLESWSAQEDNAFSSDSQENIVKVLSSIVRLNPTPLNQRNLIDSYYSYFSANQFTEVDLKHFIRDTDRRSGLVKIYLENGFAEDLLKQYLNQTVKNASQGQPSFLFLSTEWLTTFEIFQRVFRESEIKLSDETKNRIGDYFALLRFDLRSRLGSSDSSEDAGIQSCRTQLGSFISDYKVYDYEKDEHKILLKGKETPDRIKLPGMDDDRFEKVFNLITSYEFSFPPPTAAHWRLGFQFSMDSNFPMSRGLRAVSGYPLFHIGKDHGEGSNRDFNNIRVTIYDSIGQPVINDEVANATKFIADKLIRLKVFYKISSPAIELWNGDELVAVFDNLAYYHYKMFKVLAWGDNENINNSIPYELNVTIDRSLNYDVF